MPYRFSQSSRVTGALTAIAVTTSCVTAEHKRSSAEAPPPEYIRWDFIAEPARVRLSLWPAQQGAPPRMKKDLKTKQHEESLRLWVNGIDPMFFWLFPEQPLRAGAIRL